MTSIDLRVNENNNKKGNLDWVISCEGLAVSDAKSESPMRVVKVSFFTRLRAGTCWHMMPSQEKLARQQRETLRRQTD